MAAVSGKKIHEGHMWKAAGGKITGKWQKRYWKLDEVFLSYFHKAFEKVPTKSFAIAGRPVGDVPGGSKSRKHVLFCELDDGSNLFLSPNTYDELQAWLDALVSIASCVRTPYSDEVKVRKAPEPTQPKEPSALGTFVKSVGALLPADPTNLLGAPVFQPESDDDDDTPAWKAPSSELRSRAAVWTGAGTLVAVLGAAGAGKTALVHTLCGDAFDKKDHIPSDEPKLTESSVEGFSVSYLELPPALSEAETQDNVKRAGVMVLAFSLCDKSSFDALDGIAMSAIGSTERAGWLDVEGCIAPLPMMLIGCKNDIMDRAVDPDDLAMLCVRMGCAYAEMSAKTNEGSAAVLTEIARLVQCAEKMRADAAASAAPQDYN